MKQTMNYFTVILCLILTAGNLAAQSAPPQAFNYSGVARNASNNPIANQIIGVQLSILKGNAATGAVVYKENHSTNTDALGLFNLAVGTGAVQTGVFANIDWSSDNYFLKVGLDAAGGTNFITMGTTQLLSVPYALYAKSTGSTSGGNNSGYDIKLNGVSISDSSINDVAIDFNYAQGFYMLTERGYRYKLEWNISNINYNYDSVYLENNRVAEYVYSLNSNCSTPPYYNHSIAGRIYPGEIALINGAFFYVPIGAVATTLNPPFYYKPPPYYTDCTLHAGSELVYQLIPNNPSVTGFGFTSSRFALSITRR